MDIPLSVLSKQKQPVKKRKKPDLSFSYKYNGVFYKVKFYSHNNTVVHCVLYDSFFDKEFKSTAKCVPGDEFVFETGVRLAFIKAMDKRASYYERFVKRTKMYLHKIEIEVLVEGEEGLLYKIDKYFNK